MAASPAPTPERLRIGRISLAVLILVNLVNFYDRQVPGALAEPIRHEFHLSDAQIGLLGTAFTLIYAVLGVPIGWFADNRSRKRLLALGTAVWGLLTALAGWAQSFSVLLVSRLGVGVGEATCAPASTSWIGDLFPARQRAKPLAFFMLGVPVGGALSYFFSGPLAQAWGWRAAMFAAAIPALLLSPVLLLLPEPERGAAEEKPAERGSIVQVLRMPTFWWIVASGVVVNFNLYALATFLPAFFGRIHHLDVGHAGMVAGAVYGCGGLLGGTLGGFWGDAIIRRRSDGRMLIAALAAAAAAPLAYLGVTRPFGQLAFAIPAIGLAYGLLNMYYGLVYSSIQDVVPPALRGTTMAVYFMVMYLGGASFGPLLTGRLSDILAHRAAGAAGATQITEAFKAMGLQQAMLVIPALAFVLAAVLWAGARSIRRQIDESATR